MFEASWSGRFPNHCSGRWSLYWDGEEIELPPDRVSEPMDTEGSYQEWDYGSDGDIEYSTYWNGVPFEVWAPENEHWLEPLFEKHGIPYTVNNLLELYEAFQAHDFRRMSCGGCF